MLTNITQNCRLYNIHHQDNCSRLRVDSEERRRFDLSAIRIIILLLGTRGLPVSPDVGGLVHFCLSTWLTYTPKRQRAMGCEKNVFPEETQTAAARLYIIILCTPRFHPAGDVRGGKRMRRNDRWDNNITGLYVNSTWVTYKRAGCTIFRGKSRDTSRV